MLFTTLYQAEHRSFFGSQDGLAHARFSIGSGVLCVLVVWPEPNGLYVRPRYTLHRLQSHRSTRLAFFITTPSHNWVVMTCTSSLFKSDSSAIFWFDRFNPMKLPHPQRLVMSFKNRLTEIIELPLTVHTRIPLPFPLLVIPPTLDDVFWITIGHLHPQATALLAVFRNTWHHQSGFECWS